MKIAIEGPEMKLVDFDEVLDVFRELIGVSVYNPSFPPLYETLCHKIDIAKDVSRNKQKNLMVKINKYMY